MAKPKQLVTISHSHGSRRVSIAVTDEGARQLHLNRSGSKLITDWARNLVTGLGLTITDEESVDFMRNSRGWGFKVWAEVKQTGS